MSSNDQIFFFNALLPAAEVYVLMVFNYLILCVFLIGCFLHLFYPCPFSWCVCMCVHVCVCLRESVCVCVCVWEREFMNGNLSFIPPLHMNENIPIGKYTQCTIFVWELLCVWACLCVCANVHVHALVWMCVCVYIYERVVLHDGLCSATYT